MADLVLQISVSLDGFIEDRNGDLGWMVDDASLDPVATATLEEIEAMVFGRKAHGVIRQFWQDAVANPDPSNPHLTRQAELMRDLPKYVLTRSGETHGWENSHAVTVQDVARMKDQAKRPVAVFAGAQAARALLPITDEIRLIQYPILLGSGALLFEGDAPRRALTRVSTRQFPSGAILTTDRFI